MIGKNFIAKTRKIFMKTRA